MLVNKLGVDVLLLMLCRLRFCKSFQSDNYVYYDLNNSALDPGGGNSTLIRRVCATGVLNLSPCSGVGKPKKDTLLWSYHSFLKSIVLYCIVLYCIGDKDHVYALLIKSNDSIIPL